MKLKKYTVVLDENNMRIILEDGREFALIPIPAKRK